MSITATELKNNLGKYLLLSAKEDVFITKNGKGDLAVMSIEAYEELTSRFELYGQIKEGLNDIEEGNTRPFSEAISDIRKNRNR